MDTGAENYRRFLDGDDGGIADIVREYKDGLMLFINSFTDDVYLAEDLTEDTFFRLMIKKPKFSGKSSFRSWLYAIGKNVAVDCLRHRERLFEIPAEDMDAYAAGERSLEEEYIREERKILVHRAMGRLNAGCRNVLWLIYFEGFSNGEAAAVLGKNERQIRNLLYRGKQALKNELEKEGFVYEDL